jgi:hypothetical protein
MGRAISATVGQKTFGKKSDLTKFMRDMVGRYSIGDYLCADDVNFCLELFKHHSEYPQKLAPGIIKIQILIQEKGTRGFQIYKSDDSSDNISWTDCVNNIK